MHTVAQCLSISHIHKGQNELLSVGAKAAGNLYNLFITSKCPREKYFRKRKKKNSYNSTVFFWDRMCESASMGEMMIIARLF